MNTSKKQSQAELEEAMGRVGKLKPILDATVKPTETYLLLVWDGIEGGYCTGLNNAGPQTHPAVDRFIQKIIDAMNSRDKL